ncbi:DUF2314 domain-containing protein [Agrilactobacillus fermenti]|uniref:DUF2314 domain-containing protein n=1 Tax=Agrilactobacillus fermenti TaxID=2586909 RepID=UPI001E546A4A|nr:DUF2314 domain-containing protein [Agrilactobacillus fermenti]MCD2256918.1 DUF2314 domain-containing protein [Agrilactobacillus fermenti]
MAYTLLNRTTLEKADHPSELQLATIDDKMTMVKLGFKAADGSLERMWVKVEAINGDQYRGKLINIPDRIEGLSEGDELNFTKDNIIAINNPQITYECKCADA